ncbi:MAG: hypothetical protein ABIF28_13440 [Pseudomonadota bacterium]
MLHLFPKTLLVWAALASSAVWSADPVDPAAPVPSAGHRSALDGYRGHAGETVGSWRDANDRVARQAGAHAHGAQVDHRDQPATPQLDDPHAGHSAPAGAPAEGSSAHDPGVGNPVAHDHHMHHDKPAADAGSAPHHCMHHNKAAGGGMKHKHDACPMKKEGGHAHH